MKKIKNILIVVLMLLCVVSCTKEEKQVDNSVSSKDKTKVAIDIKDYGVVEVELDPNVAPLTVENFLNLVNDGFYDGLTFHRIIDGFMIQGSHERGVISMARSNNKDSASSQFFIVQKDSTYLDGDYAAFGKVTKGMEVVDKIASDAKPTDSNGTIKKEEQPVINSIKVID